MKRLRLLWAKLNGRYLALSRRERGMLAAALVLGPLLIGKALVVDPQQTKAKGLTSSLARQSTALVELQVQTANLQQQLKNDPDANLKAELAALKAELEKLDTQVHQMEATLVRPEEMNVLLERLLARQTGLRLLSLKTLAPKSVLGEPEAGKETGSETKRRERSFDLFRHGVEIRLEGSYAELLAYLVQLEQLQQRLLWGQLQYRVVDYPKAEMTLMVYTLSPDRTWLAL